MSRTMRRAELLAELADAGRAHSNAEIVFHEAASARMGLSAIEEKTLDLLDRRGPMTAGELGQHTGLAPASVTGLIDRLVRKGFVRRAANPEDGRRVNVELVREQVGGFAPLFAGVAEGFERLYADYTDAELELILGYLRGCVRILTEAANRAALERS